MDQPTKHNRDEVAVLVPAAGQGTRLGGTPKQFRTLGERPLLVQTLLVFEQHPDVGHLVVAAPEDEVEAVSSRLQAEGLSTLTAVVSGGAHRQASVRHALRAVPDTVAITLVHDAVRPFVTADRIRSVVAAVERHGAASLALPVADTLREASEEVFGETVSREGLYRMQTPQGFRRDWLEEAHRAASDSAPTATDDVELVQRRGHEVHVIQGDRRNVKITTPSDWRLAQQLWVPWASDSERRTLSSASDTA